MFKVINCIKVFSDMGCCQFLGIGSIAVYSLCDCGISLPYSFLWNKISADTLCIQVCFCMLVISFYFVNCVIISCKLSFSSRFTRI